MKNIQMHPQGKLIVFEGIDGSGKSTQINLIKKHIRKQYGREVVVTSWKNSQVVGDYLRHLDDLVEQPSALALSIIVAADLSERVAKEILPALAQGKVVLCDRYTYTGIVRDQVVHNFDVSWLKDLYSFAPKADLVVYFKVNDATSVQRVDHRMKVGLNKLIEKVREKHGKVSKKKIHSLLEKLKGSMTAGSMSGSMVDTMQALRKGEKIYQVNGDPLTMQIAEQQRMELVNHLIAAYERYSKAEGFVEVDAMLSVKNVSDQIEKELVGVLS
jgi:dTMP kinase